MRTIKFRAWHKKEKKMFQVIQLTFAEPVSIALGVTPVNYKIETLSEDYVLMQFTGLKDKNGKEIYEGDIIADRENSDYVYEVVWSDTQACFYLKGFPVREYDLTEETTDGEIIGNIYENKELLK